MHFITACLLNFYHVTDPKHMQGTLPLTDCTLSAIQHTRCAGTRWYVVLHYISLNL